MPQLYLLSYLDEDDTCLDLLMTADSPAATVLMFRSEWTDYLNEDDFSGPIILGAPRFEDETTVLRIFSIHPDPDCAGVLSWHDTSPTHHGRVKLEGYVIKETF